MRSALLIGVLFAVGSLACGGRIDDIGDAAPGGVDTGSSPVHGCSPGPCFDAGPPTPVPTPVDAGPQPSFDAGPAPPPTMDATVFDVGGPDTYQPPTDLDACIIPPGGKSCSPHSISCGGLDCPIPGNTCCLLPGGMEACMPEGATCPGLAQTCDEADNCTGGDVCCLVVNSPSVNGVSVSCEPACTGGMFFNAQACRSDTECAGGQCIPQTCMLGGASLSIEACQMIPTCVPAM